MAGNKRGDSAGARKIRRRRVQGAALSGGALVAGQLAGAVPSHAADFVVTNLNDSGAGSLRQAIEDANAAGTVDTITFQAGLTGTIQLVGAVGELEISDDVTITGPGAGAITVDAQGNSVVFDVYNPVDNIVVTISGLTVTGGYAGLGTGGGITNDGENLTLADMVITENIGVVGGGVFARDAVLTISDSTISENTALYGAGGGVFSDSTVLTITGTQFIHNSVSEDYGGGGGLWVGGEGGSATITGSAFDDNQAGFGAGIALYAQDTPVAIVDTTVTGNDARLVGGGIAMNMPNADPSEVVTITDSTISGNTAAYGGGGILFYGVYNASSRLRVDRSTISGNDGGEGGGVLITNGFDEGDYDVTHSVTISDSTISGNHALGVDDGPGYYSDLLAAGGGVFVAMQDSGAYDSIDTLAVTLANSTIAANTGAEGGGVYEHIFNDAVITLDHTIVGDNAAGFEPDLAGEFFANWSLVENPPLISVVGANNQIGVDPQLGPLQDNGGPTLTQMIAPTSPAHNAGDPAFGTTPAVDQRGRPRISGTRIDIGAVERQTSLPAVVNLSVNWRLRDRLSTGPANLPTFAMGTRPLVPLMGDWDGDGDKTPGFFKGGVFTLSNNLDGTGPPVTFTFGHVNGFPVAGDWDNDGKDEVAVYRVGNWEVRPNTNAGVVAGTSVSFGSGSWPLTVPVAGNWDGVGSDGIGFYKGNGAAVGTWTVRQTATNAVADTGPINFEATNGGYGVVGDWDGDGFDTFGTKTGATWSLTNVPVGSPPVVDPLYVFDFTVDAPNDLPLVWRYFPGP